MASVNVVGVPTGAIRTGRPAAVAWIAPPAVEQFAPAPRSGVFGLGRNGRRQGRIGQPSPGSV